MSASVDVVIVPDFAGTNPARFAARTLFFLASWMEYGGRARDFPLHVACIGDPPPSVVWLARRCGAEIRVFAPMQIDRRGACNKLRGLEIDAKTDRVLLLDADLLVLSDFSEVAGVAPGLLASVAIRPRIPERHWQRIYGGLGLPFPDERVISAIGRLGGGPIRHVRYPEQNAERMAMVPYYNSGVLLVPRDCGLRALWEDHVRRISTLFRSDEVPSQAIVGSDQAGLATAIVTLRRQGVPFTELTDRFHATWLPMYRRTLALDEIALFHALWLFGQTERIDRSLPNQIDRFRLHLTSRLYGEWKNDPEPRSKHVLFRKYLWPAFWDAQRLCGRLKTLYRAHVRPALLAAR